MNERSLEYQLSALQIFEELLRRQNSGVVGRFEASPPPVPNKPAGIISYENVPPVSDMCGEGHSVSELPFLSGG